MLRCIFNISQNRTCQFCLKLYVNTECFFTEQIIFKTNTGWWNWWITFLGCIIIRDIILSPNRSGWYKGQQELIVAHYWIYTDTHLSELCANSWMHFYINRKYTGVHIKTNLNIAVYSEVFEEISIFALK